MPRHWRVLLCMAAAAAAITIGLIVRAGNHVRCVPANASQVYSLGFYSLGSGNSIQCNQKVRQHTRRTRPGRLREAEGHDPDSQYPRRAVLNQPRADRTLPPAIMRPTTASEGAAK
jgi:hypothetical protein